MQSTETLENTYIVHDEVNIHNLIETMIKNGAICIAFIKLN